MSQSVVSWRDLGNWCYSGKPNLVVGWQSHVWGGYPWMYPVTERVQTNCGISPSSAVEKFESEFGIVSERASTESYAHPRLHHQGWGWNSRLKSFCNLICHMWADSCCKVHSNQVFVLSFRSGIFCRGRFKQHVLNLSRVYESLSSVVSCGSQQCPPHWIQLLPLQIERNRLE